MKSKILSSIKHNLHKLLNYSIYVIYKFDDINKTNSQSGSGYDFQIISRDDLVNSTHDISTQAWYSGEEAIVFACIIDQKIVSICAYWYGSRYKNRNFWPLKKYEAKLVQLFTLPENRGQGIASELIRYSSEAMLEMRFTKLYSRVWHSNYPSRKAFENNKWTAIAIVFELKPFTKYRPLRFSVNLRGKKSRT